MGSERSRYTVRQIFILTSVCLISFSFGIMVSFPSVLNPSILAPNSTIYVTSDQASWIAGSNGFSGILGFFILSPLFQLIGRKYINVGISIILLIGWAMFYFAKSATDLLSARIVQGISVGSYYIGAITLSEYSDPKRRGYFLSIKKMSQAVGSLACHSLVLIVNWRLIAVFAAAPVTLGVLMILFWPESPAFLAMKGKFNKCEKSFTWLHGRSDEKLKELKDLINAQRERLEKMKSSTFKQSITIFFEKIQRKDFLKPFFIVSLLTLAIDASGRYLLLAYLTQIITEVTGNKTIATYCAIASDCLLICALALSCILIRIFKRRILLFTLGIFATVLMFTISLALVLQTYTDLAKDVYWLIPSIILMHSFVSHLGLVPVAFAICGEVFPLEHKGLGSFACGIVITTFYGLSLKLTPLMIEETGVAGTYAIYGICESLCLILLYRILPETKDKTLQEIEDNIKGIKRTLERDTLIENTNNTKSGTQVLTRVTGTEGAAKSSGVYNAFM